MFSPDQREQKFKKRPKMATQPRRNLNTQGPVDVSNKRLWRDAPANLTSQGPSIEEEPATNLPNGSNSLGDALMYFTCMNHNVVALNVALQGCRGVLGLRLSSAAR